MHVIDLGSPPPNSESSSPNPETPQRFPHDSCVSRYPRRGVHVTPTSVNLACETPHTDLSLPLLRYCVLILLSMRDKPRRGDDLPCLRAWMRYLMHVFASQLQNRFLGSERSLRPASRLLVHVIVGAKCTLVISTLSYCPSRLFLVLNALALILDCSRGIFLYSSLVYPPLTSFSIFSRATLYYSLINCVLATHHEVPRIFPGLPQRLARR